MKRNVLLFTLLSISSAKSHEFLLDILLESGTFAGYSRVSELITLNYDSIIINFNKAHALNELTGLQMQPLGYLSPEQAYQLIQYAQNPTPCKSLETPPNSEQNFVGTCGGDFHPVTLLRVAAQYDCNERQNLLEPLLIPEFVGPPELIADHDTFELSEGEYIEFYCVKALISEIH